MEAVTGERGVIDLDIEADLIREIVFLEERVNRRDVVVILVLGGLVGFRFDQERAFEANPVLVIDDELHEAPELFRFTT